MKKIIYTFICLFFLTICLKTNVFAKQTDYEDISKPLVCEKGYDYSYLLEYEGYTIINKLVDFNHEGTYYVTYINNETKETITKRVDVISKEKTKNIYYRYNEFKVVSKASELIDVCSKGDYAYMLEKETVNEINSYYLTTTKGGKNINSKLVVSSSGVTLNKLIVLDDAIYIIGTIYVTNYGTDIYIIKLDLEGNIILENTIGGNGIDDVKGICALGEYIYLYGETTSSGGLFTGVRKKEDAFVMKLSKELLHPESVKVSTLENINSYSHMVISGDLLYILEQYSDTEYLKYNLKIYNANLDIVYSNSITNSYALYPEKLVCFNDEVYLLAFQYNYMLDKYASRIYQITKSGNLSLYYEYTNYDLENVRIIDLKFINNKPNILMYDYNEQATKLYLKDDSITVNIKGSSKPHSFTNTLNETLSFINYDKSIIDLLYIKFDDIPVINGQKGTLCDKSKINKDYNVFGLYKDVYVYETAFALYASFTDKYIEPNVSIIDSEVFDLNTKLTFNGVGTLNGRKVESGSYVSEEGKYVLEVVGTNNEKRIYNFEIACLSEKETNEKSSLNVTTIAKTVDKVSLEEQVNFEYATNDNAPKIYMFWVLLIPLILLIVTIIVAFRRKHEK